MDADGKKILKSFRLKPDMLERLNEISKETGVPVTRIIEFAIEKEFQYYNNTGKVK